MPSLSLINNHLCHFAGCCDGNKRTDIEASVWKQFGKKGAICIIDMCGFTKACQEKGIVYYLSMVRKMQLIVEPIIEKNKGHVVKFEADNCFARFETVDNALIAVKTIFSAVANANEETPNELEIALSVGIDYGHYLLLGDDYWGSPVNRASKLGEDIAGKNTILLTDTAWERVENSRHYDTRLCEYAISGVTISSHEIVKFHA